MAGNTKWIAFLSGYVVDRNTAATARAAPALELVGAALEAQQIAGPRDIKALIASIKDEQRPLRLMG
eukprot:3083183-Pyramimonas_sp.AAC.1